MASITLQAVPRTLKQLVRFGNGSQEKGESYLRALRSFLANKPKNTCRAYQRGLSEFFELWEWRSPEAMTVAEAAYYKRWLRSRGLSDSTVCLRLAACQSFFDYLVRDGSIGTNPFRLVTRKDCTPTPYDRSAPTEWSDFEKMIGSIPDDAAGKRDKALLIFFANTGHRREEVASLRVKDLNLTASPRSYVVKGKGGRRSYELSEACYDAILDHWISSNRLTTLTAESAVFGAVSDGGDPTRDPHRCMTVDQIAKILKRNAKRAGLDPRKFKLHSIRHMFAHNPDESVARLQSVQRKPGRALSSPTMLTSGLAAPGGPVQKKLDAIRQKALREAEAALG